MISKAKRERFDLGLAAFKIGYQAGHATASAESAGNLDCQGCASDELRKALGASCAEWKAFCGPQNLDCPSVACSEPDAS